MSLGLILLAAGRSERFGAADKLLTQVAGVPMVIAALNALSRGRVTDRLAVVSAPEVAAEIEAAGCAVLMMPPDQGQGDSLAAAAGAMRDRGVARVLIGLGDMPWLTPEGVDALIDHAAPDSPACAAKGDVPMPPAIFPAAWLDRLAQSRGDTGARALLRALPADALLQMPPASLADVDRREDLPVCEPQARSANGSQARSSGPV